MNRAFFLLLLVLSLPQSPTDSFQQHYRAAEALQSSGNFPAAEIEYRLILAKAYQKAGKIYFAQANYAASVNALESALAHKPAASDTLIDLSISYFHAGQFEQARIRLDSVLKTDPQNVAARHMLGKTHFMKGEFAQAVTQLQLALKLAPKDYDVAYTLGLAHLKQRQLSHARQIFDRMVAQLGSRPQLHVLIGRAYRETGFLQEAITEFKKGIAIDPDFPRVHYYLGLTYLLKDGTSRLSEAEEEFKIELRKHPDEFFANYYLGIVYTIERKWDLAVSLLEKATSIQPYNPDPFFYLGQTYQGLNKHDAAVAALKKVIALSTNPGKDDEVLANAHFRLGQSLLKVGQRQEGEKELETSRSLKSKAFKRDEQKMRAFVGAERSVEQSNVTDLDRPAGLIAQPKPLEEKTKEALQTEFAYYAKVIAAAHNSIGLLRAQREDFKAAAEQFAVAAKWNDQQEGLQYNLGLAYFKIESYKDAVIALENELRTHPGNLNAKHLLGLSYFALEDYARASEILGEVVIAKPQDVGVYYHLALSLGKLGKTDALSEYIQRMLSLAGNTPQVHILLGQAHYQRGENAKALEELKTAISLDSKIRLAHFYSGTIQLKLGKLEDAIREFEAELTLNPGDLQAKYHLGYTLLALQETERGMRILQEVIQAKPDFANAHFELGKALLQTGKIRSAVESLEKAAKLEPDQAHVHYQLGRAYLAAGRKAEGNTHLELSKQLKEKARKETSPEKN